MPQDKRNHIKCSSEFKGQDGRGGDIDARLVIHLA